MSPWGRNHESRCPGHLGSKKVPIMTKVKNDNLKPLKMYSASTGPFQDLGGDSDQTGPDLSKRAFLRLPKVTFSKFWKISFWKFWPSECKFLGRKWQKWPKWPFCKKGKNWPFFTKFGFWMTFLPQKGQKWVKWLILSRTWQKGGSRPFTWRVFGQIRYCLTWSKTRHAKGLEPLFARSGSFWNLGFQSSLS